jgi:hypothetical protein
MSADVQIEAPLFVPAGGPSFIRTLRLASSAIGVSALGLYAGWFATKLFTNLGRFYGYEKSAFQTIQQALGGTLQPEAVAPVVAAMGGAVIAIVACIISAIAVAYAIPEWHKVIRRHEQWLEVQTWNTDFWGKLFLVLSMVCFIVESVVWYIVWIACTAIVLINILVIATGLGMLW